MLYKLFLILFLINFNLFCFKSDTEKTILSLQDYLNYNSKSFIEKDDIEDILYDVQSSTDTKGRAARITNNLFLTNNHVIADVISGYSDVRLIQQSNRGKFDGVKGKFKILYADAKKDLALLQIEDFSPKSKAILHLYDKVPNTNFKVSEFLRLVGENIKHSGYKQEFGGRDLYNQDLYMDYLGTLLLPPNSALYEKKGFILEFKQAEILEKTKNLPSYADTEIVSTIPIYQGESGSPVFGEIAPEKYYMIGVSTKALSVGETVSTPNSPLGFMGFDRTVSFIVHRNAIKNFILTYIEQLKKTTNPK